MPDVIRQGEMMLWPTTSAVQRSNAPIVIYPFDSMIQSDNTFEWSVPTDPIPRPGSEHGQVACRECHLAQGIPWAPQQFDTLFGRLKPYSTLVSGLFEFENRLGPSGRPQGSTQSFQAINELVSGLDKRAPIVSIAAMTYLTGEVLVSRRPVTAVLLMDCGELRPAVMLMWRALRWRPSSC